MQLSQQQLDLISSTHRQLATPFAAGLLSNSAAFRPAPIAAIGDASSSHTTKEGVSYTKRIPNCQKCGQHGRKSRLKGHKRACPFKDCECAKCQVVSERQKLMADQIKTRRRQRKDAMMHVTANLKNTIASPSSPSPLTPSVVVATVTSPTSMTNAESKTLVGRAQTPPSSANIETAPSASNSLPYFNILYQQLAEQRQNEDAGNNSGDGQLASPSVALLPSQRLLAPFDSAASPSSVSALAVGSPMSALDFASLSPPHQQLTPRAHSFDLGALRPAGGTAPLWSSLAAPATSTAAVAAAAIRAATVSTVTPAIAPAITQSPQLSPSPVAAVLDNELLLHAVSLIQQQRQAALINQLAAVSILQQQQQQQHASSALGVVVSTATAPIHTTTPQLSELLAAASLLQSQQPQSAPIVSLPISFSQLQQPVANLSHICSF